MLSNLTPRILLCIQYSAKRSMSFLRFCSLTHGRRSRTPKSLRHELTALLSRLHVLVVGPGLGREEYMQNFAHLAINIAKDQDMFIVIDADGLFVVGNHLHLVKGYRRAVLTPNVVEFKRLSEQVVRAASYVPFCKGTLIPRVRALIPLHLQRNVRRRCQRHWAA
jgi:Carbohydrate kinase